jgi:hypothetical protein
MVVAGLGGELPRLTSLGLTQSQTTDPTKKEAPAFPYN